MSRNDHARIKGLMGFALFAVFTLGLMSAMVCDAAEKTLIIGEMEPLTGSAAVFGLHQKNGTQLAVDEINQSGGIRIGGDVYKLKIVLYDDQCKPAEGVAALEKLVERDKVDIITGVVCSGCVLSWEPIQKKKEILAIIAGARSERINVDNPWMFRPTATAGAIGAPAGKYMTEKMEVKKLAVLAARDEFGMTWMNSTTEAFKKTGGRVVGTEYFNIGDKDFYTQLTNIKALTPDAIYCFGYVDETLMVYKQGKELGIKARYFGNTATSPEYIFKLVSQDVVEGAFDFRPEWFDELVARGNKKAIAFAEAYKKTFGKEATLSAAFAYDAVYVLAEGIKKAQSVDKTKIRDALYQIGIPERVLHNYIPQDGKLFDKEGQAHSKNALAQWKNGKLEVVDIF